MTAENPRGALQKVVACPSKATQFYIAAESHVQAEGRGRRNCRADMSTYWTKKEPSAGSFVDALFLSVIGAGLRSLLPASPCSEEESRWLRPAWLC